MIRHVVLFKHKPTVTSEERDAWIASALAMAPRIPYVHNLTAGYDLIRSARAYDVALEDTVDPVGAWGSFDAFFTRALRDGARPLDPDEGAIVSPSAQISQSACNEILVKSLLRQSITSICGCGVLSSIAGTGAIWKSSHSIDKTRSPR